MDYCDRYVGLGISRGTPQGLLLFDTGVIPDELIKPENTTEARATVHKTLARQLTEIGLFAGATWLAQQAERAVMFPEKPGGKAEQRDYSIQCSKKRQNQDARR